MEKRKWENINVETSLLGFGAMRLKTINNESLLVSADGSSNININGIVDIVK